ncbi:MAG TPA: hypothetical protein VLJ59_05940 [Mycobacteriales bacterium]|nr:hypothetical protein [Mycobacteriales bacterium]
MSRHAAPPRVQDRIRSAHLPAAVLAATVGALAAALPSLGEAGPLLVVGALQALLIWAWVVGTATPGRIGSILLPAGVGGSADALLVIRTGDGVTPLLAVLGLLFPVLLAHQLSRGVVRVRLTESLSGVATECVAVGALACYLELAQTSRPIASAALLAAAAGLFGGHLVDLAWPAQAFAEGVFHGLAGVVGSVVLGTLAAVLRLAGEPVPLAGAVLLGAAMGVSVGLVAVGASYVAQTAQPRRAAFAAVTLPVLRVLLPIAVTAALAYVLGLVVAR